LTLPDNEYEVLTSFVAAETHNPSFVKVTVDGLPIYMSREMSQNELTFPILCDLGSAKLGEPPHNGMVQALPYRAPEVILGASWDFKIDIWSLGVLVSEYSLCTDVTDISGRSGNLSLENAFLDRATILTRSN